MRERVGEWHADSWPGRQIAGGEHFPGGKPIGRCDADVFADNQGSAFDGRMIEAAKIEAQISVAQNQRIDEIPRMLRAQLDIQGRMRRSEGGQRGGQEGLSQRGEYDDAQASASAMLQVFCEALYGVDLGNDLFEFPIQGQSFFGRSHVISVAHEKPKAELPFRLLQLFADCRLGNMQHVGRSCNTTRA